MSLPEGWKQTGWVAESGQAWVYQVQPQGDADGPLFALKRLKNQNRRDRFAREVAKMDWLAGERGVAVPDIVARDLEVDRPWFVMPWYPGGSLQNAVIDRRFGADLESGTAVLIELAEILADVHAAGVAHRDLKPANVLVGESGLAVTDFGLCLEIGSEDERLTETHEVVGSRLYVAPENEAGINPAIDQRPADFYAFGKVAWAVLAGRLPLPRETILDPPHRLAMVLDDPRLAPIDGLVRDLLNRDPRVRLGDWTLVLRDLRAVDRALRGIEETEVAAPEERTIMIARRLAAAPQVRAAAEDAEQERLRQSWGRRMFEAMQRGGRIVEASLAPLERELADLLTFGVTSGGAPTEQQLAESDTEVASEMRSKPPVAVESDGAVCFLIHSPQGLSTFPTMVVRVWPQESPDGVWINRLPMVSPAGEREVVAGFLSVNLAQRFGPFVPLRQATIDEAVDVIKETAALFVPLVEHYLTIVDEGGDPADARFWQGRDLVPASLVPVESGMAGDREPPDLRSFNVAPSMVEVYEQPLRISCRARIVDDASGVAGEGYPGSHSQARFRSPSGQIRDVMFDHRHRISGDAHDGVYENEFLMDPMAEKGIWSVEHVVVVDQVGNDRWYSTEDLRARGMPSRLDVL